MANVYKLYAAPRACSFIAHSLLLRLEIPHEIVTMVFGPDGLEAADGSLSHREFLSKVNPKGYVPVLVTPDGDVLTENPAIITYICSLAPAQNLLGTTPLERAKILEHLVWLSGTMHGQAFGRVLRPSRFSNDDESLYDGVRAKGMQIYGDGMRAVEARLEGREVLVGSTLSAADYNMNIFYFWAEEIGFKVKDEFPRLTALMQRLLEERGVREAAVAHKLLSNDS